MKNETNCRKTAKWLLAVLLISGAAFAYGTDARAALVANGIVVGGKTCRETERRDFADGWAVRYVLPDGERFVEREETVWTLPLDAKAWYQTYSSCYENPYSSSLVREIPVGTVMSLPVTAKLADGSYCLFTEANVVGYTDSAAKYLGEGRFAVYYVNDAKGFSQSGADVTPWRVTLVVKDLQTLATSDIVRRLCPDPSPEVAAKCAAFVKGGRSVWQWLPAGDPKYDEQKEWYDRTRALGFEYYLVDDGWKVWRDGDMDQWACLKKWIDYGKSIGVESFVWVDSKEMRTSEARRTYLRKVRECGAVGIKIDFVPAPSCAQMKWYEETLADTLEFSLMTDFHGCVKPSGRERTWPHEVAREAIRGHEWHITRYDRVLPPEHDCILPFNRLIQGHADYTPVVFEKKELQGFTWARELAQGIIFSAPFLCFGDYPKNYLENPAAELIRAIPSAYDEVRVLPGSEIGECAAFAKRKGNDWFIAIENSAQERRMTVALDFLGDGKYELLGFADADDRLDGYRIDRRAVGRDGKLDLALRPCGGYCAWITLVGGFVGATLGAKRMPDSSKADRVAWFNDARFGMFIHWGIYSIPARGEWTYANDTWKDGEYEAFAKVFNPTNYNPREWAKLAKRAGMKYAVLTTCHHDGFCMFDSHFTDYKITNTPYGKDVVREYVEAFRAEGLKVGFYHSLPDWTHPGYSDPETPDGIHGRPLHAPTPEEYAAFRELVANHVRQLMTEYGKIDLLFLDYTSKYKQEGDYFDRERLLKIAYENQPGIIVNDRLSFWKDNVRDFDYYTPEICVPSEPLRVKGREVPWETCATINGNWGYRAEDNGWKTPETLVAGLVGCVSRNGNLLLNVGPMADGSIPAPAVARLAALGDWYAANGESIFGCGKSDFTPPFGCAYTQKGNALYCHFLQQPLGDVILPELKGRIAKATLLRTGETVECIDQWGFELLKKDDQRIRPKGIVPGDVVKIVLSKE